MGDLPHNTRPVHERQGREKKWWGIGKDTQRERRPPNKVNTASASPLAAEGGYAARKAYSKRSPLSTGKLVAFRLMKL